MKEIIVRYYLEVSRGGGEWKVVKSFDNKHDAENAFMEYCHLFDETFRLIKRTYERSESK